MSSSPALWPKLLQDTAFSVLKKIFLVFRYGFIREVKTKYKVSLRPFLFLTLNIHTSIVIGQLVYSCALSRLLMATLFVLEGCIPSLRSIRDNSAFWLPFRLLDFDKWWIDGVNWVFKNKLTFCFMNIHLTMFDVTAN